MIRNKFQRSVVTNLGVMVSVKPCGPVDIHYLRMRYSIHESRDLSSIYKTEAISLKSQENACSIRLFLVAYFLCLMTCTQEKPLNTRFLWRL